MEKQLFDALLQSIREMKAIQSGRLKPARVAVVEPLDVAQIRKRLKLSQGHFAALLGISIRTVQHWEQGQRFPVGPARALLTIAARNPKAVLLALHPKADKPARAAS